LKPMPPLPRWRTAVRVAGPEQRFSPVLPLGVLAGFKRPVIKATVTKCCLQTGSGPAARKPEPWNTDHGPSWRCKTNSRPPSSRAAGQFVTGPRFWRRAVKHGQRFGAERRHLAPRAAPTGGSRHPLAWAAGAWNPLPSVSAQIHRLNNRRRLGGSFQGRSCLRHAEQGTVRAWSSSRRSAHAGLPLTPFRRNLTQCPAELALLQKAS